MSAPILKLASPHAALVLVCSLALSMGCDVFPERPRWRPDAGGDAGLDGDVDADADTDSGVDGDIDSGVDSDIDSDVDSDVESDVDGDADIDPDADGDADDSCALNRGWGATCTRDGLCDDGKPCLIVAFIMGDVGFCSDECETNPDCPEGGSCVVFTGIGYCFHACESDGDCPCGMSCEPFPLSGELLCNP